MLHSVLHNQGPFAGIAAQRYGFRPTLLAGAFMGTAGIVSSAFVPSVNWLYITYGAVAGRFSIPITRSKNKVLAHTNAVLKILKTSLQ